MKSDTDQKPKPLIVQQPKQPREQFEFRHIVDILARSGPVSAEGDTLTFSRDGFTFTAAFELRRAVITSASGDAEPEVLNIPTDGDAPSFDALAGQVMKTLVQMFDAHAKNAKAIGEQIK